MSAEDSQSLEAVLRGAELERAWQDFLNNWEDISPAQRADCLAYVVALRDQFLWFLRGVTEPAEQRAAGAIFYLQFKSQCLLLTTQAGYQIAAGKIEQSVYCCAKLLSILLNAMESGLDPVDVQRIGQFLAPLRDDDESDVIPLLGDSSVRLPMPQGMAISAEGDSALQERLDALEEEAAQLRAERDGWAERETQAEDSPEALRCQLIELGNLRAEHAALTMETGFADTREILAYIRALEDDSTDFRSALTARYANYSAYLREFGDCDPRDVVEERRQFSARIAELEAEIARRDADQERLKRESGDVDTEGLVETLHTLRDRIGQLEAEAEGLAADRQILAGKFGAGDAPAIIAKIRELNDAVTLLSTRLGQYEAERMILNLELGFCDPHEIIARFRTLQDQADPAAEIARTTGSGKDIL